MKLIKLTSAVAALAFTAILGASSSAHAQANEGDLILGFESTSSTNVYEVDLGSASQFINPSSSPLTFNLSTSDLSSTQYGFGSSWATSSAVQWGVIGGTGSPSGIGGVAANTLFTSWNTFSSAPLARTAGNQGTNQSEIDNLYNGFNTDGAATPGNTGALQTDELASTSPDGFAYHEKNDPNFNFGASFLHSQLDYNSDGTTSAPDSATLDLYELTPTSSGTAPGTLLGEFTLGSNGVLTFTEAAAPEPSSWSLIGLGGLVLALIVRRRATLVP
ncbi:MAG: PEP-CTERM sorting domain-containing protein [Methylacidiphilales bacterium]|nr:PEP-CTERM sorting domain-containing protein [Candidatus Methylacidiphilales bacterium]